MSNKTKIIHSYFCSKAFTLCGSWGCIWVVLMRDYCWDVKNAYHKKPCLSCDCLWHLQFKRSLVTVLRAEQTQVSSQIHSLIVEFVNHHQLSYVAKCQTCWILKCKEQKVNRVKITLGRWRLIFTLVCWWRVFLYLWFWNLLPFLYQLRNLLRTWRL